MKNKYIWPQAKTKRCGLMIRYFKASLFAVLFLGFSQTIIAQGTVPADAGEDKVICRNGTVQIGTCEVPGVTYAWKAGPADPDLDHHEAAPIVSPTQSTTYALILNGNCSPCLDFVEVTVIENLTLSVEDNVTECMEGRWLTFTVDLTADIFDGTGDLTYTFDFVAPNGVPYQRTVMTEEKTASVTVAMPDVLDGSATHFYNMPVSAYVTVNGTDCRASNSLDIDVYELWIDQFEDRVTGKDWKIRVGHDIAYSAIASSDTDNWDWDMEDGLPDAWNPLNGNAKNGTNMIIPNSDLPSSNSSFGDAYGTVNVFCEDGEGNNHRVYSDDILFRKAEVFYDALATTNPGGSDPNWFYYYKDAIGGGGFTYNGSLGTSTSNAGAGEASIQIAPNAYSGSFYRVTIIDPGTGRLMTTGNSPNFQYFEYFSGVIPHERHHATHEVPAGTQGDTDGDFLPSIYETSTSKTHPGLKLSACALIGCGVDDGEVYAGGPIEEAGIRAADLTKDWAAPGSNW